MQPRGFHRQWAPLLLTASHRTARGSAGGAEGSEWRAAVVAAAVRREGGVRASAAGAFHPTAARLFLSSVFGRSRRRTSVPEMRERAAMAAAAMDEAVSGLGATDAGRAMRRSGAVATGDDTTTIDGADADSLNPLGRKFVVGSGVAPTDNASTVPMDAIDQLLLDRPERLQGPKREPVVYDIDAQRRARQRSASSRPPDVENTQWFRQTFDEYYMPRHPTDPNRPRADWEYAPTEDHKALVLLLYRNILKGLIDFKSVRRRSLIAYARFAFRRRAAATEKLLIDECVEEARRAVYVIGKHHQFTVTREYEFDSMTLPKDTGQDVKTYMEEVYDPEVSRMQFQNFTDVQPGKEDQHMQNLGPTSGQYHWRDQRSPATFKQEIREEDKVLRPPPPPGMS